MAYTADSLFAKEFKKMMDDRRAEVPNLLVWKIPLPVFNESKRDGVFAPKEGKMRKRVLIKGVTEQFFDKLNDTYAELVGRMTLYKRQVLSDGTFRKDKNDKYVADEVPVPNNSIAILSPLPIGVKNIMKDARGKDVKHVPSEGFKYVDYVETGEGRRYIYIVPRKFVYTVNLVSLMMSTTRPRNFYRMSRVALQNGHHIYLYTAPFKYREIMSGTIILLKTSPNFSKEVSVLLNHWLEKKVMFKITDTEMDGNVNGITNIGFQELDGGLDAEEFRALGDSLDKAGSEDLEFE